MADHGFVLTGKFYGIDTATSKSGKEYSTLTLKAYREYHEIQLGKHADDLKAKLEGKVQPLQVNLSVPVYVNAETAYNPDPGARKEYSGKIRLSYRGGKVEATKVD